MRIMNWTVPVLAVALAAGCASDSSRSGSASAGATRPATVGGGSTPASGVSRIGERVLYFDFDSADIKPGGAAVIERWAKWLSGEPNARVRVEGHTDERGTNEYNVALGERRANAVRDALLARGAAAAQIETVSYGEDRPAASGQNARAFAQNRRVELVD